MDMLKNKLQISVTLIFLGLVGWWISFQHVLAGHGLSIEWFDSVTYGSVALIGAIIGIFAARKWGGFKSVLGKALMLFSFGLFAQYLGQLIYAYYIYIDKITVPYPSWGDAAYFGSTLLYIIAALYLAKAAGVKFSLKSVGYKIIAVVLPLILLVVSYLILLHNHQYDTSKPLTVFLDNAYPIGEAIYISIAIVAYLLSRKSLGGIMRAGILLVILALVVQYVSDFTFVYQSNRGTYTSGNYDDLFYLIAYFAMTTSMIKFHMIFNGLKNKARSVAEGP
jgi:hypothetical protein